MIELFPNCKRITTEHLHFENLFGERKDVQLDKLIAISDLYYEDFDVLRSYSHIKEKILVIGSSAGGHLAALLCAYREDIGMENELMTEDYLPNAQILCYPVISAEAGIMHMGSYQNLLGCKYFEREKYAPDLLVCEDTPKAFIWHTAADNAVSVINSYRYAEALAKQNIPCEMHIFPYGVHGLGVSPHNTHVAQWVELLRSWLHLHEFI